MEVSFAACFDELEKDANVLGAVKRALTAPIPGTKPWLMGRGVQGTPGAANITRTVKQSLPKAQTKQVGNGVYDVSNMARRMGMV